MNIKMQNNEEKKRRRNLMDFYYANLIKKYSRKMPIENDVVDKKKMKRTQLVGLKIE